MKYRRIDLLERLILKIHLSSMGFHNNRNRYLIHLDEDNTMDILIHKHFIEIIIKKGIYDYHSTYSTNIIKNTLDLCYGKMGFIKLI